MTVQATAVWRCRTGGNAANGAGYDSAISGAGTDYSQQDAAQLTVADAATSGAGSTTLTSVTGGFTSAMIGNAVKISSGTNFQAGYYFITAYTDTNTVTLDRTPSSGGAGSSGAARVGGACRQPETLASAVVAGNTVYLRASAGNASSYPTSSLDYTISSFFTPTAGSDSVGYVKWIGENGMPTISTPGLGYYNTTRQWFENLYLVALGNSFGNVGIIQTTSGVVLNCIINQNLQSGMVGLLLAMSECIGTEVYGGGTSPTSSSGADGITPTSYAVKISGCHIHHCRGDGISEVTGSNAGVTIMDTLIHHCVGRGALIKTTATVPARIRNCTIASNGSDGIGITSTAGISWAEITNNIIVANGGYGLNVTDGSTAVNDRRKRLCDYNNYGTGGTANSSGARSNVSAGSHDLAVDPQFTDAGSFDYSVGTNMKAVGIPSSLLGSATTSYVDLGAAQREEVGGSGGITRARLPSGLGSMA